MFSTFRKSELREQFSDTGTQTGSVQCNLSFVDFTGLIAVYLISSSMMKVAVTDRFNTITLTSIIKDPTECAVKH